MKNRIVLFLFVSIQFQIFAQEPNWAVNSSNFQYSMTITAFLNVNGITLTNANDKIGAFVNNENRGEAKVVYNPNAKKYLVYLTVYANQSGETVNFKVYDSQNNIIVTIPKTINFAINENFGGVFQSISMANPALASTADLQIFTFQGVTSISSTINANEVIIFLPQNTTITSLTPVFTTSNNAKVFRNQEQQISGQTNVNFTNDVLYQVLSEDETVLKNYIIKVTVVSNTDAPTALLSSNTNDYINSKSVLVNLTFSKEITGLSKTDFTLNNAIIKNITTQNNKDFLVDILAINQGLLSVQLKENTVQDASLNNNEASNIFQINIDLNQPIVSEIIPEGTNFSITFSEDVQNVLIADFNLVGLAQNNFSIDHIEKRTNKNYLLTLTNTQANFTGNVYPLITGGNIKDLAGNSLQNQTFEMFVKQVALSTNQYLQDDFVSIYPNPTKQSITINLSKYTLKNVVLYNLQGKIVKNMKISNLSNQTISLPDISSSVYFLKIITSDDKVYFQKIIKN